VEDPETVVLHVEVEVTLDSDAMTGRPGYKSGISANHRLPGRSDCFLGTLTFIGQDTLAPGAQCKASAVLLVLAQDREQFQPGLLWQVCEASKVVGQARIISVRSA
jgi:hypothetical protein